MNYDVDVEIINNTPCDKEYSCVCLRHREICQAEKTLGCSMLTLSCKELLACRHKSSYGDLHLCKCPVRVEIFRKYGK